MQLRPFSALTQTASASIYAYPCTLTNMDGTLVVGTAPLFFQLFDKASAPVANDVPIAVYEITSSGPFPLASVFQSLGPIPFALGLAVGISTDNYKYTAAAATYSVLGEIEESQQSTDGISGLTTIGDITTHIDSLSVWQSGDSNGTKNKLFRLKISNVSAGDRWVMLFGNPTAAVEYPRDGHSPIMQWKLAASEAKTLYFGSDGLKPYQIAVTATAPAPTAYYGCALIMSSTAGRLTTVVATDMTCQAQFKAVNA